MNKVEFKQIVDELVVDKKSNIYIYYDINQVTNKYVIDMWNAAKKKMECQEIVAIIMPKTNMKKDVILFFDNGFVLGRHFVFYRDLEVAGNFEVLYMKEVRKYNYIFYGNGQVMALKKTEVCSKFAYDIVDKIIEMENKFTTKQEKIEYYLKNIKEDDEDVDLLRNIALYHKLLELTKEKTIIGKYVRRYGTVEYVGKYLCLSKKYRRDEIIKAIPKVYVTAATFNRKKSQNEAGRALYFTRCRTYESLKDDCFFLQKYDAIEGYTEYVSLLYCVAVSSADSGITLKKECVREFNMITDELKKKIEEGVFEYEVENNANYLELLIGIGDLYYGELQEGFYCVQPKDEANYLKCGRFKNVNKALYWYELFVKTYGSKNTVEYGKVTYNLSNIFKYGSGELLANENKMIEFLKESSSHGYERAYKDLAEYYLYRDADEKEKWVTIAKEHGQKIKDKRSLNERMKESVGIDIAETAETIEAVTGIGRNVSGLLNSVRDAIGAVEGIATDYSSSKAERREADNRRKEADRINERGKLEDIQYFEGQKVSNKKAKAKNMKAERKADKAIAKEEKKRK